MSEEMNQKENDEVVYSLRKCLLFFGLPWTFTKYTITPSMLTMDEGLFKTVENDCYMYKIQDVRLTQTLIEKIFGLGTVECFSGDVTNPDLTLVHIKQSKEVKNFILDASEKARIKRRTVTTYDIGMNADDIS
ncbi:MAG: PH domain-containing protein [Roseburia sp.]|nr:PH domain-containing protein [Roseburia sp.]